MFAAARVHFSATTSLLQLQRRGRFPWDKIDLSAIRLRLLAFADANLLQNFAAVKATCSVKAATLLFSPQPRIMCRCKNRSQFQCLCNVDFVAPKLASIFAAANICLCKNGRHFHCISKNRRQFSVCVQEREAVSVSVQEREAVSVFVQEREAVSVSV